MATHRSTDLVRRAHALVRHAGTSRSTADIAFEAEHLRWHDLPRETQNAAEHHVPVVAEGAVADGALYRVGPERVQVMRAWRAHRDRLYVAVACRAVDVTAGVVVAMDPWRHVELRQYDVVGQPRRRIGWVPAGIVAARPVVVPGDGGASVSQSSVRPEHSGADGAWPHLPSVVRDSAVRAVPVPEDWIGDLVQESGAGRLPLSQEITVLRRDAERAVVLTAARELRPPDGISAAEQAAALARADWLVEQVVMTTARPRAIGAGRAEARGPWA